MKNVYFSFFDLRNIVSESRFTFNCMFLVVKCLRPIVRELAPAKKCAFYSLNRVAGNVFCQNDVKMTGVRTLIFRPARSKFPHEEKSHEFPFKFTSEQADQIPLMGIRSFLVV